jgi:hypothetical protein
VSRREIEHVTQVLGIAALLDRRPAVLSGGAGTNYTVGEPGADPRDARVVVEPFADYGHEGCDSSGFIAGEASSLRFRLGAG